MQGDIDVNGYVCSTQEPRPGPRRAEPPL